MGFYLTDQLPFNTIFLHNIINDSDGEKMSKSKGNCIDPRDIINGTTLEKMLEKIKALPLPEEKSEKYCKKMEEVR